LLTHLKAAVPAGWTVLVLSDRGLESPDLFRFVVGLDWHPLMRVKKGGKFRPQGWGHFYYFHQLLNRVGASLYVEGVAYTGQELPCTLLACWSAQHQEPWLLLTDLPPEAADALWYGLRTWIEQGFKVIKGGCWDWHKTRMDDPGRVERLWLVLAVATLWVVAIGAADEVRERAEQERKELERRMQESVQQAQERQQRERYRLEQQRQALAARKERERKRQEAKKQAAEEKARARQAKAAAKRAAQPATSTTLAVPVSPELAKPARAAKPAPVVQATKAAAQQRIHRVSRRGLAVLCAAWDRGKSLLPQHLHPEPWPQSIHCASHLTEEEFLAQQK
jgi:hypothetical protein